MRHDLNRTYWDWRAYSRHVNKCRAAKMVKTPVQDERNEQPSRR